jgi:isochorismate hydrolase
MQDMEALVKRLNTHSWRPEKGRTAVLLIDLEEYFRGLILPILGGLLEVIHAARKHRLPLLFTRHRHVPGNDPGMLGRWWADLIREDTPQALLLPELAVADRDIVVEKDRYSAFFRTGLEETLRDLSITDLVIGGVMTNLCCETTARDAFVRDFRVFFLADGTSTAHEDFHQATLKNLAYGFATLLTCRQLIRHVENAF